MARSAEFETTEPAPAVEQGSASGPLRSMFDGVMAELRAHHPDADPDMVELAFETAVRAHAGQVRKSGEPYLMHPLRVAGTIARLGLDAQSVAAGLMHDSVEDSELTTYEVSEKFGRKVAELVDGVTKLGKVPYLSRKENQAESFRKMLLAMSRDIRVLIVKLADRLDNMRTLESMPPEKRERIARETMQIYAPLAGRLGIDWLRAELLDLSFRYLEPASYEEVSARMDELLAAHPQFVDHSLERLRDAFARPVSDPTYESLGPWPDETWGHVELRASLRSVYSVHQSRVERESDQVSDLISYQIITRDRAACYAGLAQVHAAFKPVPGLIRDYIALPRPNHYQALHTSVVDRNGVRMDLQIRSSMMDEVAERGIVVDLVASESDPSGKGGGTAGEQRRLAWLNQLMDWQDEISDPNEFIEAVQSDLFADEIYVFTPRGDILTFPRGATPIDFAFSIHTDVGLRCSGARVNGHVVPLRYRLHQGDTVEILTSPRIEPRREWLELSKTSRARAKIKQWIRQRDRARSIAAGRGIVHQSLVEIGLSLEAAEAGLEGRLDALGITQDRGLEGVYEEVGAGRLEVDDVLAQLGPHRRPDREAARSASLWDRMLRRGSRGAGRPADGEGLPAVDPRAPIRVDRASLSGEQGMIQLATCCAPVPGDPLVGFLEPGRGIVAHVQECPRALEQVAGRRVYLLWGDDVEIEQPVTLEVRTSNDVGMLAAMSRAFSQHGVDIKQALCRAGDDRRKAVNTFHATIRTRDQLDELQAALKEIAGVATVERRLEG